MGAMDLAEKWVGKLDDINVEEYQAADAIVRMFRGQQDKRMQVTVSYNATLSVTIKVPNDWDAKKVLEEIKYGYYLFEQEDTEQIDLKEITYLVVNGYEVDVKTGELKPF